MTTGFGEKLRLLRKMKKLTQAQMAEKLGVSHRSYFSYEKGEQYPSDTSIYASIAEYFDVSVDYLMNEKDAFVIGAQDKYGYQGLVQAQRILQATEALYAGGSLSEPDEEAFFNHMTRIFDRAKKRHDMRQARAEGGPSKPHASED